MRAPKDHPAQFDELDAMGQPDAAPGVMRRRLSAAATKPAHAVICAGCGASFSPNRPDQRCCSATCRKRLERRKKRDKVGSPAESVTSAAVALGAGGNRVRTPARRFRPLSKIPDGYPPDVAVSAGADGLPVFFDVQGDRLFRIWGPSRLSAVELRALKLESTELIFPGGRLYRKVPA